MRWFVFLLGVGVIMAGAVSAKFSLTSTLGAPEWISKLIAAGIFFYALFKTFQILLVRRHKKELCRLSTAELRKRTFRYSPEYFSVVGEDHAPVRRFRRLLEEEDLDSLTREWPSFESEFRKLESKAGRTGRSLIMDYYDWYEHVLAEMRKRQEMNRG